jgi:VanZ family protein
MFMVFVLLFHQSFPHAAGRMATTALMSGLVLAFGVFMESIQAAIPGRYASWGDMALNFLGIFLGMVIVFRLSRRKP